MNRDRRIIVSVALGFVLAVVASTLAARVTTDAGGYWFTYEPAAGESSVAPSGDGHLGAALIWLCAIGVWAVVSWRLFAERTDD